MAKKSVYGSVPKKRPKFEIEAVQYVSVTIPGGGGIGIYSDTPRDITHTFTQSEAFDLADAVRDAARKL